MPCTQPLALGMDSSSLLTTRSPPGWSAQAARAFASAPSRQSAEALRQQLRSLPAESDLQGEIDGAITELGGSRTFALHEFFPMTPTFLGTRTYVDRLNGRNTFARLV